VQTSLPLSKPVFTSSSGDSNFVCEIDAQEIPKAKGLRLAIYERDIVDTEAVFHWGVAIQQI
jgi:hypothetical protein